MVLGYCRSKKSYNVIKEIIKSYGVVVVIVLFFFLCIIVGDKKLDRNSEFDNK